MKLCSLMLLLLIRTVTCISACLCLNSSESQISFLLLCYNFIPPPFPAKLSESFISSSDKLQQSKLSIAPPQLEYQSTQLDKYTTTTDTAQIDCTETIWRKLPLHKIYPKPWRGCQWITPPSVGLIHCELW